MEAKKTIDRSGLPPLPLPPRCWAPVAPRMTDDVGDGSSTVPEGSQNQPQLPENVPNSSGLVVAAAEAGSGIPIGAGPTVPNVDDKKLRRLLSNRVSAQRSRMKRANYIADLEKQVNELQAKIAQITPEITVYRGKKRLLELDNELMKRRRAMVQEHLDLKHAETDAHHNEIFHLKQFFEMQRQHFQFQSWMTSDSSMDFMADQSTAQAAWPGQNSQPWVEPQAENLNLPYGWEQLEDLGILLPQIDEKANVEACNLPPEIEEFKEM